MPSKQQAALQAWQGLSAMPRHCYGVRLPRVDHGGTWCRIRGQQATGPAPGSPEAAIQMLDQLTALIARYEQEAAEFAAQVRQANVDNDRGWYLDSIRAFDERKMWIHNLRKHLPQAG